MLDAQSFIRPTEISLLRYSTKENVYMISISTINSISIDEKDVI